MKAFITTTSFACLMLLASCGSYDVQCSNAALVPYFKSFQPADIDTFIVKKYTANNNFAQLLDTFRIIYGQSGYYTTQHDTTVVRLNQPMAITAGYDWKLFIPAKNKTISITAINAEQKTIRCNRGIFSLDKTGCSCFNAIQSYKQDNQLITPGNTYEYILFIQ